MPGHVDQELARNFEFARIAKQLRKVGIAASKRRMLEIKAHNAAVAAGINPADLKRAPAGFVGRDGYPADIKRASAGFVGRDGTSGIGGPGATGRPGGSVIGGYDPEQDGLDFGDDFTAGIDEDEYYNPAKRARREGMESAPLGSRVTGGGLAGLFGERKRLGFDQESSRVGGFSPLRNLGRMSRMGGLGGMNRDDESQFNLLSPDIMGNTGNNLLDEFEEEIRLTKPLDGNASMLSVVKNQLQRTDDDSTEAVVGYSARTERMHHFLSSKLNGAGTEGADGEPVKKESLEFTGLCKASNVDYRNNTEKRMAHAGCFFELLVMKTHSIIELGQSTPYGQLHVTRGPKWTDDPTGKEDAPKVA